MRSYQDATTSEKKRPTVLGLPRKKRCCDQKGPRAFAQRHSLEKRKVCFYFFASRHINKRDLPRDWRILKM